MNEHKRFGRSAVRRVTYITVAAIMTACGGYGGGSGMPPATANISVSPMSITLGQSATLTWSTNGTMCTASGAWSGTKAASGSQTVTPTAAGTATYTLVCSGGAYGGSSSQSAMLTVTAAAGTMSASPPSAFSMAKLVSDGSVTAATADMHLVNPRGIVFPPNALVWVANNGTQTSKSYGGTGTQAAPVVAIPAGLNGSAKPTGIVFNRTTDFIVTHDKVSAPASFIVDGEGGTIAAWADMASAANARIMYDDGAGGAVYTGLAIANNRGANFLYAADFHNNKIDVFDKSFIKVTGAGGFADSSLPAGYAAFGIQALQLHAQTLIFVAYAKQAAGAQDKVDGAGLGLVNVFDTNGTLQKRLIAAGGALNAPWGMALAPANFGTLSNALLIGNSGDGVINGYDPMSGAFIGSVNDANGQPIATPGLWGTAFGNGANNQPTTTLYFAAGIAQGADGLYGRISLEGSN